MRSRSLTVLTLSVGLGLVGAGDQPAAVKDKVLVFFGVYTQWYRLDKALADAELTVSNAHSQRAEYFPAPKDLLATKLVILSDCSGREFTEAWARQLKAYVERGGSLLVLGGPFTLGVGRLEEVGLADLLPVELEKFDLKWEKAGLPLRQAADHPILKGVPLAERPMVYWIHRVKPKADAQVILAAGDYPCLVAGRVGQGRVVVFAGTPLGLAGQGHRPFWEWDGWLILVKNLGQWLMTREGR